MFLLKLYLLTNVRKHWLSRCWKQYFIFDLRLHFRNSDTILRNSKYVSYKWIYVNYIFRAVGMCSQDTISWSFACISGRHPQRWLVQLSKLCFSVLRLFFVCYLRRSLLPKPLEKQRWSSHFWKCLPKMQAKRQEFVTWELGPPPRKISCILTQAVKA